jgi:hypothetical protein
MKTYLKLCVPILFLSLACAFVQNLVLPPSPTPVPPPASKTPALTKTSAPPTKTAVPLMEPIDNPEPIDCSDDACLDACLDRLDTVMEAKTPEPIGNAIYEEESAEFDLVIYKVNGNEISDPITLYVPEEYRKYQKDTDAHKRIWDFYVAVIPPELRTTVKEFIIFTDGPEETTAWVNKSNTSNEYSQVGFDLLDADYPPYLADTLVHETAHLIFLSPEQVPHDQDRLHYYQEREKKFFECEQYVSGGDCSLPASYINLFYQKFWKTSYAEWWQVDQAAQDTETSDEYWDVLEKFYDKHNDWFLDSYAATDVEEDMAESFAFFVLNPKLSGASTYEQKVAFFYGFPELVEYRRQMIEGLCSFIQ